MEVQDYIRLDERMEAVERMVSGRCTAEAPHDTLSYSKPLYRCRCGQLYKKSLAAPGALQEVREDGS